MPRKKSSKSEKRFIDARNQETVGTEPQKLHLGKSKALLLAALRVWELKHRTHL